MGYVCDESAPSGSMVSPSPLNFDNVLGKQHTEKEVHCEVIRSIIGRRY